MDWKLSFSVGIEEIDAHHRELISLFRRIAEAIEAHEKWSDIHFRIVDLRQFADFHFEFEEGLMRLFAYPAAESHAISHRDFFKRLDAIERTSLQHSVQEEMVKFLYDWLTGHILGADRGYAEHILGGAPVVRSAAR